MLPTLNCTQEDAPANSTGSNDCNIFGGVPAGTTFNVPQEIISIQALMIIGTIAVFFASMAGCADAASEPGQRAKSLAG